MVCGNLWKPDPIKLLNKFHNFFKFDSLDSSDLFVLSLKNKKIFYWNSRWNKCKESISKKKILLISLNLVFLIFIQAIFLVIGDVVLRNGNYLKINHLVSTCHLIDKGIDTGPILRKKILDLDMKSYEAFRASVYPQTAIFVSEIISDLINGKQEMNFATQNETIAKYRKYIGDNIIAKLKKRFF